MINYLFDRNGLLESGYFNFTAPLDKISEASVLKSSFPFYYTYSDGKFISINFRIGDIGTCYKVTVYKNTDYTKIMSETDIESYLMQMVFPKIEEKVDKLFSDFSRTKIISSDPPKDIHYSEIHGIGYCWSESKKERYYTGKTSLISKKNNLIIEHQTWMKEFHFSWDKSSGFRFIIINESDDDIKKMKSAIVKRFYRKLYDQYTH